MANLQARIEISADAEAAKSAARETRREFAELNRQLADVSAYEAQEKALADTTAALADAKQRQAELGKAVTDSGGKEAVAAYKKVTAEVEKLSASLQDQEQKLKASGNALKKAGIDSKDLAGAQIRIASAMDATKAKLDEQTAVINRAKQATQDYQTLGVRSHAAIQAEIDKTRQAYIRLQASGTASSAEMKQALEAMRTKTAALKGEMQGVAPASTSAAEGLGHLASKAKAFVAVAITAALTKPVTAMESLKATMASTFGSMERANQEMDFTAGLAQRLGADVVTLSSSYNKLAASTRGTALEGQRTRDLFEGFAVAMAKAGASSSDLDGAMTQLSQAMGKGKADLQDVKAIMEKIPGSGKLFAEVLGVSTKGLYDMISAGELGRDELEKIGQKLNQVYNDGSKVEGLSQSWQRFTNIMSMGADALSSTSGAGSGLAAIMEGINKVVALATVSFGSLIIKVEEYVTKIGALKDFLAGGSMIQFGEATKKASEEAAAKIETLQQKMFGLIDETKKIPSAGQAAADGIKQTGDSASTVAENLDKAQEAMKLLGVEMQNTQTGASATGQKITEAFGLVVQSAQTGEQVLAAYANAMKKVGDDTLAQEQLQIQLKAALDNGLISLNQYNLATGQASMNAEALNKALEDATTRFQTAQAAMDAYAASVQQLEENKRLLAEQVRLLNEQEQFYQAALVAGPENAQPYLEMMEATKASIAELNEAIATSNVNEQEKTRITQELAAARQELNMALQENNQALNDELALSQGQLRLDNQLLDTKRNEVQGRMAAARARGDEKEVQRLQVELLKIEQERIKANIEAKEREAEVMRKKIQLMEMQAMLDGTITAKEQAQIDIMKQKLSIIDAELDSHRAAAAAKEEVIKATERAAEAERKHGQAAKDTADAIAGQADAKAAAKDDKMPSGRQYWRMPGENEENFMRRVERGEEFNRRLIRDAQAKQAYEAAQEHENKTMWEQELENLQSRSSRSDEAKRKAEEARAESERRRQEREQWMEEQRQQAKAKQQQAAQAQQAQPQAVKVVRVDLNLPGGKKASVDVLPGQEDTLTSFMKQLETAVRVQR